MRTCLSKPTPLITAWTNIQLLRPSRINVLLRRPIGAAARALQPCTQRAFPSRYALEPLSFPAAQLHDLMLEPLLALIPCPLDRPACRLITTRHPARDACFGRIAPYVGVDGCEEGIVSVFEGGRGQDLAELVGQLFLIEVAEEEKGEGLLVRGPVDIAYRALDCRV